LLKLQPGLRVSDLAHRALQRLQLEQRYSVLEAWTRWTGRASAGALAVLAAFVGIGALLARSLARRSNAQYANDAARFEGAVGDMEHTNLRLARAVEEIERRGEDVRGAGRDLADTTLTVMEIGRTFGDGAANVIGRLETGAETLRQSANRSEAASAAELERLAHTRSVLGEEIVRLQKANDVLAQFVDQARPGLLAAIEALLTSAHAFDHASEAAKAGFEEAVQSLTAGEGAAAEALARTKADVASLAAAVAAAVERLNGAAEAFGQADHRLAEDTAKIEAARRELRAALAALVGKDGILAASARRVGALESHLKANSVSASDRFDQLAEQTATGLMTVLRRLDQAANDMETAAARFWRDEAGATVPVLEALRAAMAAAEAPRAGPRLASA
ncbi:MAG: hypothetical protein AAGL49_07480, partial [Pseudomonadota bacterium]